MKKLIVLAAIAVACCILSSVPQTEAGTSVYRSSPNGRHVHVHHRGTSRVGVSCAGVSMRVRGASHLIGGPVGFGVVVGCPNGVCP